jgi:hypothetical protein
METVSNIAAAASKAIWGEQNTTTAAAAGNETAGNEPVSGLQGKGTATEPFDQGNAENPAEPAGKSNINEPGPASSSATAPSATGTTSTDETPSKPQLPTNTDNVASGGPPKPLENTEGTGVTDTSQKYTPTGGDVVPSEASDNPGAAPASGAVAGQKQQGADRPSDGPTGDAVGAVKSSKDDAEDMLKKRDPNDHSGEPMHVHGAPESSVPATQDERRESKAGMPGGQEHGKDPKGTGEQWEKTTGLHADGGNFDATKPGAGREADRILEEKGIHKTAPGDTKAASPSPAGDRKEKVPLKEKIKDKLHIGHKDK